MKANTMKKTVVVIAVLLLFMAIPMAYAQNGNETVTPEPEPTLVSISPIVPFAGLLVGIILAVFLPYMRKVWQGTLDAGDWSNKYLLVIISGLGLSLITALMVAPQVLVMEVPEAEAAKGSFGLFLVNFAIGFGETGFIKELLEFGKESETATAKSAPPVK